MTTHITAEQENILKSLREFEKNIPYQSIGEIQLANLPNNIQQKQSITNTVAFSTLWIEPTIQQMDKQHIELQRKLAEYKAKSNLIQTVGNLIHEYDVNFKHLQKQRSYLIETISGIHKDTSDLIEKQKKYIDLTNSVKEALDYYTLLDKFQFNYVSQPAAREVFEDQLQPTLSELTDGIQFFTTNSNYTNSKKYLNGLVSAKTKVTSFTKSYLIKLFNKQYGFTLKNSKTQIGKHIDSFYPKSKPKFLTEFLSCFPQFLKQTKIILMAAKESSNQAQGNDLIRRQAEIQEFIMNDRTISLITYLQKNIPEVYEEVVLKFISFYRINFHENLHKNLQSSDSSGNQKFEQYFRDIFIQSIYILTCQAGYLWYFFKPCTEMAKQYARGTLAKISQYYSNLLSKLAKQPGKNKDPFNICNQVSYIMMECDKFIRNYTSKQYQSYVLGAVIQYVQCFGIELIRSIFQKFSVRIKVQLEAVCQNMLPKFKQTNDKTKLMENIKEFVRIIPNLKYCSSQAQKYLIGSLDTLIKSIKEVSSRIQSRLECYAWNIEIFALIEDNLAKLPYSLVKKQMKLDVGQTTRIIEKVKNVQRDQNILRYATDLFSVIRTGVPTLSELTLDFNSFIKEYHAQLKQKFVKDMVFVHGKNIIEFLQALEGTNPQEAEKLCEATILRNLQSSYKLSIENFINQAGNIIVLRQKQFAMHEGGEEILINLLNEVKQMLLDLMGKFYSQVSKITSQTEKFENIVEIRAKFSPIGKATKSKIEQK